MPFEAIFCLVWRDWGILASGVALVVIWAVDKLEVNIGISSISLILGLVEMGYRIFPSTQLFLNLVDSPSPDAVEDDVQVGEVRVIISELAMTSRINVLREGSVKRSSASVDD